MHFRKFALPCLFLLAAPAFLVSSAQTQKTPGSSDVAIEGLFEFTPTVSGNGITVRASKAGGGGAYFRHSYHWWLGYEAGYTYTRFSEFYTGQIFGYQQNLHDFSGSYYVHRTTAFGLESFATAGISALIFSPSLNGGQNVGWQAQPGINFSGGVNVPLREHFGARVQYRGVFYQTPNFSRPQLTTNTWRITSEPEAGIYFRF